MPYKDKAKKSAYNRKHNRSRRENLTDSYIRTIIMKHKYNTSFSINQITPQLIIDTRQRLLLKRLREPKPVVKEYTQQGIRDREQAELYKQGLKRCNKCKAIKSFSEYRIRRIAKLHRYSSETYVMYESKCRLCYNKYRAELGKSKASNGKTRNANKICLSIKRLTNKYIVQLLKDKGIPREAITPELIALQRILIQINRQRYNSINPKT